MGAPDRTERRPGEGNGAQNDQTMVSVRITGCPCGCRTRLPWLDDPDCLRHQPLPQPVDWPAYDARTLGLPSHDRETCEPCKEAGR